jgi:hypothetical protein
MPDNDRPLKADLDLLAARDIHFEHTKKYFEGHDAFEEKSWHDATDRLIAKLQDADELGRRSQALREKAESRIKASKQDDFQRQHGR